MSHPASTRAAREQAAYDGAAVMGESAKLHCRFSHVFLGPNSAAAEDYFFSRLAEWAPGSDVLECGCHDGTLTYVLTRFKPRSITGIDISRNAIEKARAERGHLAGYQVMDASALSFPDEVFDLVIGRAILHHLDFEQALIEIHRVLRPGGHAAFMEPLRGNPAARFFRALTPRARTADEAPLTAAQVRLGDKLFGAGRHLYANLVSVPVGVASSLLARSPDNWAMRAADVVDRALAPTVLRYWMRGVVLTWQKPHQGYTYAQPSAERTRT
jgi:SAM-dependent methyltransferase